MKKTATYLTMISILVCAAAAHAACGVCGSAAKKAAGHDHSKDFKAATGLSQLADAKAAGETAAKQAKASLGGQSAKVVLVFHNKKSKGCLEGVTSVFDPAIVFGGASYDPITEHGNKGDVAVLAIGGNVSVATACAAAGDGMEACGKAIGERLKDAAAKTAKGSVLVLFGDCHIPANDKLVKGVQSVLGEKQPIVGGAAHQPCYYQGKALGTELPNMGILLSGNFKVGLALRKDESSPAACIACAEDAVKAAVGDDKDHVAMVFAMDCGGRRGTMKGQIEKELVGMQKAAGAVPIFGFYGSGEMGHTDNASPAKGVGYSFSAGAIIVE